MNIHLTEDNLYRYLMESVNELANCMSDPSYNFLRDSTDYVFIAGFSKQLPFVHRRLYGELARCVHEGHVSFEECKPIALAILKSMFDDDTEEISSGEDMSL